MARALSCCPLQAEEQNAALLAAEESGNDLSARLDGDDITNRRTTSEDLRRTMSYNDDENLLSIIQFSSSIYYAKEGEEEDGTMKIDVVRMGDSRECASVSYETFDSSAKAGVKYEYTQGRLDFEENERLKTIKVPIHDNESWDATLEFEVRLSNVRGAQLGKYLHYCRVIVIDDDFFPSNRYRQHFEENKIDEIPNLGLFREFFKCCWSCKSIRWRIIEYVFYDFINAFGYFMSMYLQVYLVDVVLAPLAGHGHEAIAGERLLEEMQGESEHFKEGGEEEEEEVEMGFMLETLIFPHQRRKTAMLVAGVYLVPYIITHVTSYRKCYLGLKQRIRKMLQANLLRKYLYYDEVIRCEIKTEHISLAMMRDIFEVVDLGFMKFLTALGINLKLAAALIFILAENKLASAPLIVCACVLPLYLWHREKMSIEVIEEKCRYQDLVLECVNFAVSSYRLIADFFLRPKVIDGYEVCIDNFHREEEHADAVFINNVSLAPWLTALSIGIYMIYGATEVTTVGGTLRLGVFLTTINIFKEVGAEIQEIYIETLEVQKSFGPLQKVSKFMNMQTDLEKRKNLNRHRRDFANKRRESKRVKMEKEGNKNVFAIDQVEISMHDVTFTYMFDGEPPAVILTKLNAVFDQGKLHAFVGSPHGGKATLLKLLGQVFMLDKEGAHSGNVFVPSHLRVLHVAPAQECCLIKGSFCENLVLSAKKHEEALQQVGGIKRVEEICRLINFEEEVLKHLHDEVPMDKWSPKLTQSAMARLSLARAFIMNPEVLVLHKPTNAFNDSEVNMVVQNLRNHVDHKGLDLPEGTQFRRPRTVFFSSATLRAIAMADHVYKVTDQMIIPKNKDEVTVDDLA